MLHYTCVIAIIEDDDLLLLRAQKKLFQSSISKYNLVVSATFLLLVYLYDVIIILL
jgi:hypothetical protein